MDSHHIVQAGGGAGFFLKHGECVRIIDLEGGQTGDLVAFSADGAQRLSNGRSFDYCGKIFLSTGDVLWSDRSSPLMTIIADEVGRHDFLYAPCSLEMFRKQYGVADYHPNCHDNLCSALRAHGVEPMPMTIAFNLFMNVEIQPDGRLSFAPPRSRAGDSITLRAEMDLVVALTACPTATCNGGAAPKPLAYEILT